MKLFSINKALLWKEWEQNRWVFAVFLAIYSFFSAIYITIGATSKLFGVLGPDVYDLVSDFNDVMSMPDNTIVSIMAWMTIAFGIAIIIRERTTNTFEFLSSTPVSKIQILNSKYIIGILFILFMMLINAAYCFLPGIFMPLPYMIITVFKWIMQISMVLIAMFTIGIFIGIVCGNWVLSGVLAVVAFFGPSFIKGEIERFLWPFNNIAVSNASLGFLRTVETTADYMNLFNFLGIKDMYNYYHNTLWISLIMLVTIVVFYVLSVMVFNKNNFERNGRILMFGDAGKVLGIVVPLVIAFMGLSTILQAIYAHKFSEREIVGIFAGIFAFVYAVYYFAYKVWVNYQNKKAEKEG